MPSPAPPTAPRGDASSPAPWVTAVSFGNPHEAELAKVILEGQGIPARIDHDVLQQFYPGRWGTQGTVHVQVPLPDFVRARTVLGHETVLRPSHRREQRDWMRVAALALGLIAFFAALTFFGAHLYGL